MYNLKSENSTKQTTDEFHNNNHQQKLSPCMNSNHGAHHDDNPMLSYKHKLLSHKQEITPVSTPETAPQHDLPSYSSINRINTTNFGMDKKSGFWVHSDCSNYYPYYKGINPAYFMHSPHSIERNNYGNNRDRLNSEYIPPNVYHSSYSPLPSPTALVRNDELHSSQYNYPQYKNRSNEPHQGYNPYFPFFQQQNKRPNYGENGVDNISDSESPKYLHSSRDSEDGSNHSGERTPEKYSYYINPEESGTNMNGRDYKHVDYSNQICKFERKSRKELLKQCDPDQKPSESRSENKENISQNVNFYENDDKQTAVQDTPQRDAFGKKLQNTEIVQKRIRQHERVHEFASPLKKRKHMRVSHTNKQIFEEKQNNDYTVINKSRKRNLFEDFKIEHSDGSQGNEKKMSSLYQEDSNLCSSSVLKEHNDLVEKQQEKHNKQEDIDITSKAISNGDLSDKDEELAKELQDEYCWKLRRRSNRPIGSTIKPKKDSKKKKELEKNMNAQKDIEEEDDDMKDSDFTLEEEPEEFPIIKPKTQEKTLTPKPKRGRPRKNPLSTVKSKPQPKRKGKSKLKRIIEESEDDFSKSDSDEDLDESFLDDGETTKSTTKKKTPRKLRKAKVYDSVRGTTCHQCKQKTLQKKAVCSVCSKSSSSSVKGVFCESCLKNRYGVDIANARDNKDWVCPLCEDSCNCSSCRRKLNKIPISVTTREARRRGFESVHAMLVNDDNV